MPATDILNPTAGWDTTLGDSMNPSYGFTRKRASTQLRKRAVGGTPWTREIENSGHSFQLSWLGRTFACVQRLKQYCEQYEDGVFTIVDWDGGGRQYVGHFTSEVTPVETSNNKWDVQNVTFEEVPRQTMVQYPNDWDHDSVFFAPWNDYGDQKLATSSVAWSQQPIGGAAPQFKLGGILRTTLPVTMMLNPGNAGDSATYEYRGYGFRLWLARGPNYGQCDLWIDQQHIVTLDCYNAAAGPIALLYDATNTPLDIHDVQIVCAGTKNAASSSTQIGWWGLQVMR